LRHDELAAAATLPPSAIAASCRQLSRHAAAVFAMLSRFFSIDFRHIALVSLRYFDRLLLFSLHDFLHAMSCFHFQFQPPDFASASFAISADIDALIAAGYFIFASRHSFHQRRHFLRLFSLRQMIL